MRPRNKNLMERTVGISFRVKWIPLAQVLQGLTNDGYRPKDTSEFMRAVVESVANSFIRRGDTQITGVVEAYELVKSFKLSVEDRSEFDLLRNIGEIEFSQDAGSWRNRAETTYNSNPESASKINPPEYPEEVKRRSLELSIDLIKAKHQRTGVWEPEAIKFLRLNNVDLEANGIDLSENGGSQTDKIIEQYSKMTGQEIPGLIRNKKPEIAIEGNTEPDDELKQVGGTNDEIFANIPKIVKSINTTKDNDED